MSNSKNKLPCPGEDEGPKTWIFQANPVKYRICDSLINENEELWNVNQHIAHIHIGDRVLIWLSGDEAGIYAVGRVMTEPVRREDSIIGIGYWKNPLEGLKVKARVKVRYENVFLDKPLKKQYLQNDDELSELKILHCAMGTNFAVTNDQWCAIHHWLDDLLY